MDQQRGGALDKDGMKRVRTAEFEAAVCLNILRRGDTIIGVYWIPSTGGWRWYAKNGDCGDTSIEREARRELMKRAGVIPQV